MTTPVSPAQPLAALTGQKGAPLLQSGDTLAARVTQQLQGGLVRLSLAGGLLDVKPQTPLPTGTQVTVQVLQGGTTPKLTLSAQLPSSQSSPQPTVQQATPLQTNIPGSATPASTAINTSPTNVPVTTNAATPAANATGPAGAPATTGQVSAANGQAVSQVATPTAQTSANAAALATPAARPSAPSAPLLNQPLNVAPAQQPGSATDQGARQALPQANRAFAQAASRAPTPPSPQLSALQQALSQSASRQTGLVPLMALAEAVQQSPQLAARMPQPVNKAIARLLGLRLDGGSNDTSQLARNLANQMPSGKSALANAPLKAGLSELQNALGRWLGGEKTAQSAIDKPPPPNRHAPLHGDKPVSLPSLGDRDDALEIGRTLLARTEGALQRVRMVQLSSIPDEVQINSDPVKVLAELPVMLPGGTGTVQMRLERDPRKKEGGKDSGWRISFACDTEGGGPAQATIDLDGEEVSVELEAQKGGLVDLLKDHIGELGDALEAAGLDPRALKVRRASAREAMEMHLLDRST